jgi:four helix bundle suffix protein
VARASLEELRLDYEDFLRQRGLMLWDKLSPHRVDLIARRPATADDVAAWVKEILGRDGRYGRVGKSASQSKSSTMSIESTTAFAELSANAALTLIIVACSLLDRQLAAQAKAFEAEGGFTERLYKKRREAKGFK